MPKTAAKNIEQYFEGTGRRKTAVARVRITIAKTASFIVNGKSLNEYFQDYEQRKMCEEIFVQAALDSQFDVSVKVFGGGLCAQAEAIRHGIARALLIWKPELKSTLRLLGFLKRDSRMRERKKFGLRRARRARQWRKR